METVNISQFRSNLLAYLKKASEGNEIMVTSHGEVLATIVPPKVKTEEAKAKLKQLAKNAVIKDVVAPIEAEWDALE